MKRTRRLIERAFEELVSEKGFQQLTVQDIADWATVNRTTFYAHFEDKHALLETCIREGFQQVLTATVPASAAFSAANVRQLAVAVFSYLDPLQGAQHCRSSERQALEPLVVMTVEEELHGFLLEWLQYRAMSLTGEDGTRSPKTTAAVMSWAIVGVALQWAHGDKSQPMQEVAGQVVDALVAGLAGIVVAPSTVRHVHEREAMALSGQRM